LLYGPHEHRCQDLIRQNDDKNDFCQTPDTHRQT
jgi:hypothetical protein